MAKCCSLLAFLLAFLSPVAYATCHPDDLQALQGFAGKINRRTLQQQQQQPNTITGTNNSVRSGVATLYLGAQHCRSGDNNNVSGSNNTVTSGSNVIVDTNHVVTGATILVTCINVKCLMKEMDQKSKDSAGIKSLVYR
ncbi:hypothetical protein ZWY2020_006777 [Hordeum vulgare]|nr:hypothetical protein ZWY2020_006777 [Hordeum vulgare]